MKALIQMGYSGKLTGVERSKLLFQMLQCTYSGRIDLFNEDLSEFIPMYKFDLILWMWSGITDFSDMEQIVLLKRLSYFLKRKRAACY